MNKEPDITPSADSKGPGVASKSRRALLGGGLAATTAAAGGFFWGRNTASPAASDVPAKEHEGEFRDSGEPVSPHGAHQAGIMTPPLRQALVSVLTFDLLSDKSAPEIIDKIGAALEAFQDPEAFNGMGPSDLTGTVGIGPAVVRKYLGRTAPGASDLPVFAREEIADEDRGGDLVIQLCCTEPARLALAQSHIEDLLLDECELKWATTGFRGSPDQGVGRNLLGFHDGVSVPKTDQDFETDVWLDQPPLLSGGTLMVVRKMRIDVRAFTSQTLSQQEQAIGRERKTGIPLSGGNFEDDPDLHAKADTGEYAIPNHAHVRRAHPLPAGAPGLMLRRSYSYSTDRDDQGLVFISFQKEMDSFIKTQRRMDEGDALLDHTMTIASGSFLILPGFKENSRLGDPLRSA